MQLKLQALVSHQIMLLEIRLRSCGRIIFLDPRCLILIVLMLKKIYICKRVLKTTIYVICYILVSI